MSEQPAQMSSAIVEPAQTVVALPPPTLPNLPSLPQAKYSKRVLLKTILIRDDHGLGLVGETVIIGGWVKSSKELKKDVVVDGGSDLVEGAGAGAGSGTGTVSPPTKDVTCVEMLQSRIPLFRSLFKVLHHGGSGSTPRRQRIGGGRASSPPVKVVPYVAYLQVNDGSCVSSLQVVLHESVAHIGQFTPTGTSILVEGVLRKTSIFSGKHTIELEVKQVIHVGTVDTSRYPLAKTRLTLDTLRSYSHLRPRTTTVASVTRIRSSMTQATHTFFQSHGFIYVHTPIITSMDSKSSSEKFQVTTASNKEDGQNQSNSHVTVAAQIEALKSAYKEKSNKIEELKRSESNKEALITALQDLQKVNGLALELETQEKSKPRDSSETGKSDFFHHQMYLTDSAQLYLESYACAIGSVYTFGPTFHAENPQSMKHLAESWMVETEIPFAGIEEIIDCAEDYVKFLCQWVSENCLDDMKFVSKRIGMNTVDQLHLVASSSFEKITYAEAVNHLNKITDKTFRSTLEWGLPLSEEQERYLAEEMFKRTVLIYDYPKEVKPFSIRINEDRKFGNTVAAFDVIMPKVGKIIRGGQREDRVDMLSERLKELNLPKEEYEWYLDLRRHGTVKHSGFSLCFDQLVLFATGLNDIRDVIPFPRTGWESKYTSKKKESSGYCLM